MAELRDMRIAVTGATGLLGGYLVRALVARGARPIAVVRDADSARGLEDAGIEVRTADIGDVEALAHAFEGANAAISNAAFVSLRPYAFQHYLDVNVEGTIHTFEAMRAAGIARAIHVSSVGIYRGHDAPVDEDHPRYGEGHRTHRLNGYKVSKALAEETAWRYASKYEIDLTTLRPSVMYGAFDRNFGRWHRRLIRLKPVALYPDRARCGLVYAGDVAEAAMRCFESPAASGKAYNVAGLDLPLRDFADAWRREDDRCSTRSLALPTPYRRVYATDRIERELGWSPRPYAEGIRETLELERSAT
ncbi:MAG: NAD-dependent epimerase/dehydratase family protein [bacterium]|nr:NAD-dependent epimerase/dehydratase family protein [bacterium]